MSIRSKKTNYRGFTLIELMVTLSIAGILLSLAAPSFTSLIISNKLTTYNNELVSALNLARSEAIKRNQIVVVERSGTNWHDGWQVFVDTDRTAGNLNTFNDDGDGDLCEASEDCLLRAYSSLASDFTINSNTYSQYIAYKSTGQVNGLPGTFAICENGDSANSKEIVIIATGRAKLTGGNTCAP